MSYLDLTADYELVGELSPDDYDDACVDCYTDADFASIIKTANSTSGTYIG